MIKSFRHKGLRDLFETGKGKGISGDIAKRVRERLLVIDAATKLEDLNIPGWSFHSLKGPRAGRFAVKVSGPWRITFEFNQGHAERVDLEQYH